MTSLWLEWTGIPNLQYAAFDVVRSADSTIPTSQITLKPMPGLRSTWDRVCDIFGVPEDSSERDRMPIRASAYSDYHQNFWSHMIRRETDEVDGPLEWWWQLMVLRFKGVKRASNALLGYLFNDTMKNGLVSFVNPSLNHVSTTRDKLLVGLTYSQPTQMYVSFRNGNVSNKLGIDFDLKDEDFKCRVVSTILRLSVSVNVE